MSIQKQETSIDKAIASSPTKLLTIKEFIDAIKYDISALYIDKFWLSLNTNKNPDNKFSIHLDADLIKMIGYAGNIKYQKKNCIRMLKLFAQDGIDYQVITGGNIAPGNITRFKADNYYLTPRCFKKLLLKANTKYSDKVYEYYLNLEELVVLYTKYQSAIQIQLKNKQLKIQEEQHQQQMLEYMDKLELTERIKNAPALNQNYEPNGYIYVGSFDGEMLKKSIFKIGHVSTLSKQSLKNRLSNYQTGKDTPFHYYKLYEVYDASKFDDMLKNIFKPFKETKYHNTELVRLDLEAIDKVIQMAIDSSDQIHQFLESITNDDYIERLSIKSDIQPIILDEEEKRDTPDYIKPDQTIDYSKFIDKILRDNGIKEGAKVQWIKFKKLSTTEKKQYNINIDYDQVKNTIKDKAESYKITFKCTK